MKFYRALLSFGNVVAGQVFCFAEGDEYPAPSSPIAHKFHEIYEEIDLDQFIGRGADIP